MSTPPQRTNDEQLNSQPVHEQAQRPSDSATPVDPPESVVKNGVVVSSSAKPPQRNLWIAWLYIFDWYPSHYSKEEKRLLKKLDRIILPLMYNLFHTFYNIGYLVLEIPVMLIISRPKLSRWILPICELLWTIVTFCQSRNNSAEMIYGMRFLMGLFETPAASGSLYILASWYRSEEVFKRAGVWYVSSNIGAMFGGYMQAAAHAGLDGKGGMQGWRWVFIIDGIISLPIAIAGFFLYPGIPTSPRICFQLTTWVAGQMIVWVKSTGEYSVEMINILPTGVQAFAIVVGVVVPSFVMVYPIWVPFFFAATILLFCHSTLLVWDTPLGLHLAAYFMLGMTSCITPMLFPWVHLIMKDDNEAKSFTTGAMMTVGWALFTWYNVVTFPITEGPRWTRGFTANVVLTCCYMTFFLIGQILWRRDQKRGLYQRSIEEEENQEALDAKLEEPDSSDSKPGHVAMEVEQKPVGLSVTERKE
ncbi:hypothetical protein BN1723_016235 [Verticillium longisporum]|uniref:Major facilitator superfamily (MFS) profile domain-containing protein n=1 Tax=Verticillium longisporum TaxID=100787 RepID=A0A0G4NAY9_VERLO|nr:hypothetical protein BN1723_016235 [Verticillium longisporum]